jgi:DNA-directed RNA polymerase specialized sigma24 family protein
MGRPDESAVRVQLPTYSNLSIASRLRPATPEMGSMLAEIVENLVRDLSELERPILVLRLEGYTVPEIAVQVERPERSVKRVLQHIRKRLSRLQPR